MTEKNRRRIVTYGTRWCCWSCYPKEQGMLGGTRCWTKEQGMLEGTCCCCWKS